MTLIDQIRADREAGTPGPWVVRTLENFGWNIVHYRNGDKYDIQRIAKSSEAKDARRIARVPELEDAYEAVLEENDRLRRERDHYQRVSKTYAKRVDKLHVAIRPFAEVLAAYSFAKHQLILLSEDNPKGRRLAHLLPDQFEAARAALAETGGRDE